MIQITLKAARVNSGLTLKEAAKEFNISQLTLANYERDSTNVPRSFFIKIRSVYGIPVDNIYFGKQEEYSLRA
jgi:transcriptional regulator with XRE-family HTH domain